MCIRDRIYCVYAIYLDFDQEGLLTGGEQFWFGIVAQFLSRTEVNCILKTRNKLPNVYGHCPSFPRMSTRASKYSCAYFDFKNSTCKFLSKESPEACKFGKCKLYAIRALDDTEWILED